MSHLHTCLNRKAIEEIRNFLDRGGGTLGGYHQVGFVALAAAVLMLNWEGGPFLSRFVLGEPVLPSVSWQIW